MQEIYARCNVPAVHLNCIVHHIVHHIVEVSYIYMCVSGLPICCQLSLGCFPPVVPRQGDLSDMQEIYARCNVPAVHLSCILHHIVEVYLYVCLGFPSVVSCH
jgi:hypothetical protein